MASGGESEPDAAGPPTCVKYPGDLILATADDVIAAADVGEVTGDLVVNGGIPELGTLGANALPCLTAVRGSVVIGPSGEMLPMGIVIDALEVIDGGLSVGYVGIQTDEAALAFRRLRRVGTAATPHGILIGEARLLKHVDLPVLEQVYGDFTVAWIDLPDLRAPELRTVTGSLMLGPAAELASVDLEQVRVGGALTAVELPLMPYSRVRALAVSAAETDIQRVGCSRVDRDMSPDCNGS
jgi:hypothetical protein